MGHRYDPIVEANAVRRPGPDGAQSGPARKPTAARAGIKAARSLLLGMVLLMAGNGLQGSLLGVRAESEGFGLAISSFVLAAYFLGFLFGTKTAEHFLGTVGHIRVFAALTSMTSAAAILFSVWIHPLSWAVLRFAFGLCMAGIFVTVESWLNNIATNATRGRLLALYMVATMGGMGAGQFLLNAADPDGFKLFVVASTLISVSLVPVSLSANRAPELSVPEEMPLRRLFGQAPLAVVTSFCVGTAQGTLVGLGALYAATEGLPVTRIALFTAASIIGSVAMQWPVGAVSDRVHRRYVVFVVAAVASAASGLHLMVEPGSLLSLALMFTLGGSTFPLYSLAIAIVGDNVSARQLNGASASLVRAVGIGAVVGPTVAGAVMAATTPQAFFVTLVVPHVIVVGYVAYRMLVHEALPVAEQGKFVAWPARASAMAANLLRRPRRPQSGRQQPSG